jgi:hypothetical protein
MFETSGNTRKIFENLTSFQTVVEDRVATFDRTLDTYFDQNAGSIVEEWGLITDADIKEYARKLDYLSYEVGRLVTEKDLLKNRADSIQKTITDLEAKK